MRVIYYPGIFDAETLSQAKEIILTTEGPGADTETRWARETPYVLELLRCQIPVTSSSLVVDYGCGIGRIAKAMIDATGCFVIGVDISARMRQLASDYVGSDRFCAMAPEQFDKLVEMGLRVDAAIAVWVLQHCLAPAEDVDRICRSLVDAGHCFVLNMPKRAVPALVQDADGKTRFVWASDRKDVRALLCARLTVAAEGQPDMTRVPKMADAGAFWMSLRNASDALLAG